MNSVPLHAYFYLMKYCRTYPFYFEIDGFIDQLLKLLIKIGTYKMCLLTVLGEDRPSKPIITHLVRRPVFLISSHLSIVFASKAP